MRAPLLPVFLLLTAAASGQTPGSCDIGRALGTLDASGVSVTYPTTGGIAYGPGISANYFVPREDRISPLYAANIWIGGTVEGEFRVAGATYGQGGTDNDYYEFWPGPLDPGATLPNPADCSQWDRIWVVSTDDIETYEETGIVSADLRDWPVGLGASAIDVNGTPLPVISRDQTLDLAAGERPIVLGTEMAFWILNDVGNEHRSTDSKPLGIEVAVTAWVVSSPDPIFNRSSFVRYRITNRSPVPIRDLRFTLWADPDLGNAGDDFVGIDTTRSLAYVYNADEPDDRAYGLRPPAFGVRVLGGEGLPGVSYRFGAFTYAVGGDPNRADPSIDFQYERIMRGVWRDGTPITALGNGYSTGGEVTTFAFYGDPVLRTGWSEERLGLPDRPRSVPGDRRFMATTEPVPLAAGASTDVDLAFVFAQGDSRLGSVYDLFLGSDAVQRAYDDGSLFQTRPRYVPPRPTPPPLSPEFTVGPNPTAETLTLRVRLPVEVAGRLSVFDAGGRRVWVRDQGRWPAGETAVQIDVSRLAPGAYLVRFDIRGQPSVTRSVAVVR